MLKKKFYIYAFYKLSWKVEAKTFEGLSSNPISSTAMNPESFKCYFIILSIDQKQVPFLPWRSERKKKMFIIFLLQWPSQFEKKRKESLVRLIESTDQQKYFSLYRLNHQQATTQDDDKGIAKHFFVLSLRGHSIWIVREWGWDGVEVEGGRVCYDFLIPCFVAQVQKKFLAFNSRCRSWTVKWKKREKMAFGFFQFCQMLCVLSDTENKKDFQHKKDHIFGPIFKRQYLDY